MSELYFNEATAEALITPTIQASLVDRATAYAGTEGAARQTWQEWHGNLRPTTYGVAISNREPYFYEYDRVMGMDTERSKVAGWAFLSGAAFMYRSLVETEPPFRSTLQTFTSLYLLEHLRGWLPVEVREDHRSEYLGKKVDAIVEKSIAMREQAHRALRAMGLVVGEGIDNLAEQAVSDVTMQNLFRVGAGIVVHDLVTGADYFAQREAAQQDFAAFNKQVSGTDPDSLAEELYAFLRTQEGPEQ